MTRSIYWLHGDVHTLAFVGNPGGALNSPRRHLHGLTALRFWAAALVYIFHLHAFKLSSGPSWFTSLSSIGFTGVSLFFVLSGFVLVYTYAGRSVSRREFWWARLARIYPAYLFSLILSLPIFLFVLFKVPMTEEMQWIAWFKNHLSTTMLLVVGLLQAWGPRAALGWNSVAWTLSAEAFFYLVFPFALARLARCSRQPLYWLMTACWLLGMGVTIGYSYFAPDAVATVTPEMNHLFWLNVVRFNPLVRLPEFIVGMCCGLLFLNQTIHRRWATALIGAGVLSVTLATFTQDLIAYPVLHNALLTPGYSAIIFGLALAPSWAGFLGSKLFQTLGEASYSFYLTHSLVIAVFFQPSGKFEPRTLLSHLICFGVATAVAIAIYRWIEVPSRRRLQRLFSRRDQPNEGELRSRPNPQGRPPSPGPGADVDPHPPMFH